jgi:hypothetical protein
MKKLPFIPGLLVLALLIFLRASAQEEKPLRLAQTIALPAVEGRIDHLAVDVQSQRLFLAALGNNTLAGAQTQTTTINFDSDKAGDPPKGFTTALTGRGRPGVWVVVKDDTAPSKSNVLAQTDADTTGYRFPVCVYDSLNAKDADISVKIKAISGTGDQGGGIVWRYKDKDNYYIVRANALENNVVLYRVLNGKREDLPLKSEGKTYGKKVKAPSGQWNTLRVTAQGNVFTVYFNGQQLYQAEDETFKDAGKIGLWTKADSVIHFDDLQVMAR